MTAADANKAKAGRKQGGPSPREGERTEEDERREREGGSACA